MRCITIEGGKKNIYPNLFELDDNNDSFSHLI